MKLLEIKKKKIWLHCDSNLRTSNQNMKAFPLDHKASLFTIWLQKRHFQLPFKLTPMNNKASKVRDKTKKKKM